MEIIKYLQIIMTSLTISPNSSPTSPERTPLSPDVNNMYEVSIKADDSGQEVHESVKDRLDIISANVSSLEKDTKISENISKGISDTTKILESINNKQTITSTILISIASMVAFVITYPFLKRQ